MNQSSFDPPTSDSAPIWEAIYSRYHCYSLLIADEIGLFRSINDKPANGEEIANRLQISPRSAEVITSVLASHGHLVKHADRYYLSGSSKEFLVPESPYYMGDVIEMCRNLVGDHKVFKDTLLQDKPTYTNQLNPEKWETDSSMEQLRTFAKSVHAIMLPTAMAVAMKGNFSGVKKMLDVAGGSGCYSIALAIRHPEMDITIFELPAVCQIIPEYTSQYGLENHIKIMPGDMFRDSWPQGYDAHFFSNIFHDWNVERCRHLAQSSFAALPPGGHIFLHESLINNSKDGPRITALYSMNMAAWTPGGKQYSALELEDILTEAGFTEIKIIPAYSHFSLISARKP